METITVCVQIFVGRKFHDFHESAWVHENKNAKISPYLGLSRVIQNAREDIPQQQTCFRHMFLSQEVMVVGVIALVEHKQCL